MWIITHLLPILMWKNVIKNITEASSLTGYDLQSCFRTARVSIYVVIADHSW